jgi:hypothetical protein
MRIADIWESTAGNPVRGRPVDRPVASPPRIVLGARTCEAEGCQTRLSMYNGGATCWQHEPLHRYYHRVRERRTADTAA